MSYRRNGRGLLGLLVVAVLGLMALASSAWAVLPVFLIDKKAALHATVGAVQDGGLETLLVPGSNIEIKCPEFEVTEGLILDSKVSPATHATLLYKGCKVFSISPELEESLVCHVSSHKTPNLLHIEAEVLLLPVEFPDGKFGILAEKIVAKVLFLKEMGCPLPLSNVIKGEVCFKITAGNETVKPLIESNETIQQECPEVKLELDPTRPVSKDKILFGTKEAFIDAKATLFLTGAHKDKLLGVSLI